MFGVVDVLTVFLFELIYDLLTGHAAEYFSAATSTDTENLYHLVPQ